jgi:hypothetical protein
VRISLLLALCPLSLAVLSGCHLKPHPRPGQAADGGDAVAAQAPSKVDAGDAAPSKGPVDAGGPADDSLPAFTSEELTTRARHLLEAISKDDPDLATDIVFPRDAYLGVKDVPDPGKTWDGKVLAAFKKDVHALRRRTKGVERAIFTSFELGQPASEAMPKKHDLKRMLWRSRRSRLGFTIDGKPSHFDVVEMTGWRGAWYVTKLK